MRSRTDARGQVLVIAALALVVLLGAAAFTIDLGRRAAEERFIQNAADAAALAGCRTLTTGASQSAALQAARDVAAINLAGSPAGATPTLAAAGSEEYLPGHHGNPVQLINGAVIDGGRVRVAIHSTIDTTIGRVLGRATLDAIGRASCILEPEPTVPVIARRYENPPGPDNGFKDHVATTLTSGDGRVDQSDPRGYDTVREPASELQPGPEFQIYGPNSKAVNDSSFRGFIALDVRDFTDTTSRKYYNGTDETMSSNNLKNLHQEYLATGYPGPPFPAVANPPTGDTQVGILSGVTAGHVTQEFLKGYAEGDRVMLAVYDGTVMKIPDFAIQPPVEIFLDPLQPIQDGPAFEVSRNDSFNSEVTFTLLGDAGAASAGTPEYDVLYDPSATPAPTPTPSPSPTPSPTPTASPTGTPTPSPTPTPTPDPTTGKIQQPTFTPNTIVPAKQGTAIQMTDIEQNAVPEGIYAVWIQGTAGAPYNQQRRQPVSLRVGEVPRRFDLDNSILDGEATALGDSISLELRVATESATDRRWNPSGGAASQVTVSLEPDSLTDCSYHDEEWTGSSGVTFDGAASASVMPDSGGGTSVAMTINTAGLSAGCYLFAIRAQGTNHDGEPVVRVEQVRFTVAATSGPNEYVDILGFAVFEITQANSNEIWGQAITGIYADPTHADLRTAQRPRLIPWN